MTLPDQRAIVAATTDRIEAVTGYDPDQHDGRSSIIVATGAQRAYGTAPAQVHDCQCLDRRPTLVRIAERRDSGWFNHADRSSNESERLLSFWNSDLLFGPHGHSPKCMTTAMRRYGS
jgi:hypothetical protein